ncbi:MAG: hypothetical protein K0R17_3553 [Rariglobus sp.]|jgi:hypothetical protein|nr:hypothetical protein [Rariglobus sp.]
MSESVPLLNGLGALSTELGNCAKLAAADNNNEASLAFASARDRLDEVVCRFVATDKAAFFNPALGTPCPTVPAPLHGPN